MCIRTATFYAFLCERYALSMNIFFIPSVQEVVSYQPLVPAVIHSDGNVVWHYPTILESTCHLKVDNFPWDQQCCKLKFISWSHDRTEVGCESTTHVLSGLRGRNYVISSYSFRDASLACAWCLKVRSVLKKFAMSMYTYIKRINVIRCQTVMNNMQINGKLDHGNTALRYRWVANWNYSLY